MREQELSAPEPSHVRHGTATAVGAKFGTHHAWAFDVPPWAAFFNAPPEPRAGAEWPANGMADGHWLTAMEASDNVRS
jgi:hypothetical protein